MMVWSLFVPHLSFFWCLGRAVQHDCTIFWLSSHIFLQMETIYLPSIIILPKFADSRNEGYQFFSCLPLLNQQRETLTSFLANDYMHW